MNSVAISQEPALESCPKLDPREIEALRRAIANMPEELAHSLNAINWCLGWLAARGGLPRNSENKQPEESKL
ncbi:hypothetical protein GCM10011371_13040 [Novosphingobium marinum]|uniref:Uncharacterized protein n=1 Tax=Novosphingobium marinum TaxID=1514948 RepID=A0A7Y9XVQ1_9SPHN|nr:hypothetical protein [Novosphingobium marinum]NYH95412.1 hypothetical protein [Novosphingobium marinum]GGC26857.1 hypothetical protein GCM10011371_13040 [Novosphingobium marinum]